MSRMVMLTVVLLTAILMSACAGTENTAGMASLTGTVTFNQRIALGPTTIIEVRLVDVSRADAPAVLIAQQEFETGGRQVPIPFELRFDPARIDERMTYALEARITQGTILTWVNAQQVRVLTQGAPKDQIKVLMTPARS